VLACISSEYVTLHWCFWKEKTSGLTVKKNGEVIKYISVTLSVGPYLIALCGFWRHTNNVTGKESVCK
jgi:hypothetical protein